MGSEAGQSESDECELTSVSAEVNPFFLKKSGCVSQGTCSQDNIIMWSNRSGGASPSTTQTSVQTDSNPGNISSFKPCASALRPASLVANPLLPALMAFSSPWGFKTVASPGGLMSAENFALKQKTPKPQGPSASLRFKLWNGLSLCFRLFCKTALFLTLLGCNGLLHQLNGLIHPFAVGTKQSQILLNAIGGQAKAFSEFFALLEQSSII